MAASAQSLSNGLQSFIMNWSVSSGTNDVLEINSSCQKQVERLGYKYFNYAGYFPICEAHEEISSFPDTWGLLGSEKKFSSNNPIFELSQNRTVPFYWKDMVDLTKKRSKQVVELLKNASEHNIHGGLCIPIHGAGAEWGMLNVASQNAHAKLDLDQIQLLKLFATSLHEAVKRANAYHLKEENREKTLSPRELECLDWAAAGKTAWETAEIIGISENTVTFHIRNAISKLNASNRAHAVAIAMARSIIHKPH